MADYDVRYYEVERAVLNYTNYYGARNQIYFTVSAIAALMEPGEDYRFEENFRLEYERLEFSLSSIFDRLNAFRFFRGVVAKLDMQIAMKESKCHYLWLC
jgi:hypothetical protein